jgi:hypothetical protein
MSYSILTLLLRNLSDVFGENDSVRRRAAIDEIFHEDAVFYDPKGGQFRGRDEIDRIAGVIKATPPDFEHQPLFPPEELGDAGRVRWVSCTPDKPLAYVVTFELRPNAKTTTNLQNQCSAKKQRSRYCEIAMFRNDLPVLSVPSKFLRAYKGFVTLRQFLDKLIAAV